MVGYATRRRNMLLARERAAVTDRNSNAPLDNPAFSYRPTATCIKESPTRPFDEPIRVGEKVIIIDWDSCVLFKGKYKGVQVWLSRDAFTRDDRTN